MAPWAIVIGINAYPAESTLKPLHGAVADAADFADWCLDDRGGGVASENLFFHAEPAPADVSARLAEHLVRPPAWLMTRRSFEPTAGKILREVQAISRSAVETGATRIYVFLAGHGGQTSPLGYSEDPQNCFIAIDYVPDTPALGLVNCDDMRRYLQNQGPAEIVMFLDCCRNHLPLQVPRPPNVYNVWRPNQLFLRYGVGRAAQGGARAFEIPVDVERPERGAFSKVLLHGLRGLRVSGQLTLEHLEGYVTDALVAVVAPNSQVPDFEESPRPRGLVLATSYAFGPEPELRMRFSSVPEGTALTIRDKDAREVTTFDAVGEVRSMGLPIGSYSIEHVYGGPPEEPLAVFNHLGPGRTDVVL